MSGHFHLIFAPAIPIPDLEALSLAALVLVAYALFRRSGGALCRAALFAALVLTLANPSLITEQHEPLKDTVLIAVDDSASMKISDRPQQMTAASEAIQKKLAAFPDLDIEIIHAKDNSTTELLGAIQQKLASLPHDRLAGIIAITDGQLHEDAGATLPAPLHILLAGHHDEIDRRLIVKDAPAYGIVGNNVTLTLRVDDEPAKQSETAVVTFSRDQGAGGTLTIPVNKDSQVNLPIDHAGPNLFTFSVAPVANELTNLNNSIAISINGIRDRLHVLLVSNQPHVGGRTWRNFLKTDPSVDLIHFTILRSPMKQDNIPDSELSLIAFPVHELFQTKLPTFDLIIFDGFREQSLIPDDYLDNIANYVENGGALLLSSSTESGVSPLALSSLARVLPAQPTGKLLTGAFVPDTTDIGKRHPVTDSLTVGSPREAWGPWYRQLEAQAAKGDVLMTGLNNQPLLVLDHVGKGRVAQFLSDQYWLWSRGYDGGGPQAELLRRTVHWLMKEPELEETALHAHAETIGDGWQIVINKQSLHDSSDGVTAISPSGTTQQVTLNPGAPPGLLTATVPTTEMGIYHLKTAENRNSDNSIPVMVGALNPEEFGDMRATEDKVAPMVKSTGGSITWLADQPSGPDIRRTGPNEAQHGWNWIGLRQNGAYRITGSKAYPLLPPLLMVIVLLLAALGTWWREGKR
jgi:uncharacterized membrane protein